MTLLLCSLLFVAWQEARPPARPDVRKPDASKAADAKPGDAKVEPSKVAPAKPVRVPYQLTNTKHVLVRVKLNGKGPFNFVLDTGAPALFLSEAAAEKAGI